MSPSQSQKRPPSGSQTSSWVRIVIVIFVLVFAFGGIIAFLVERDDSNDVSTSDSTVPTTPQNTNSSVSSAAGKPCVPVAGALPAGAPAVPVKVGPPPTELVTEDLEVGTGAEVASGATVTVDYIGVACSTGAIFDSSYSRGETATFPLSDVIPGWGQGIPGMKVGGTRLLGIPAALGYGDQGAPPDIAPGETLWFVVKVHDSK